MSPAADRLARARDALVVVLLVVGGALNFWAMRDFVFEDAYITFRYAANLAAGDGFVFQPGEKVLGTSTPLLTLLLALLGVLGFDIPRAGAFLFAASISLVGFFGWRLLAGRGAPNAGALFALAAVSGIGSMLHYFGMETALHVALIFLATWLAAREKPWPALGVALGLLMLNRYDGVIPAAAVLLVVFLARRRLPWRAGLLAGAIFAGWLFFAQLYFGHFLPNTYAAKAADVGFAAYAEGSLRTQALFLLTPVHRLKPEGLPRDLWLWTAWLLAAALAGGLGAWLAARRQAGWRLEPGALDLAPLALSGLLLWLGYSVIGPPLEHPWYLVPTTYCVLALALAAASDLCARLPSRGLTLATVALLAAGGALLPKGLAFEQKHLTSPAAAYDRIASYTQFARFVRHHGLQDTTLLTREPGYLTYLSGQRTIDAAGLVTPGIFTHGPDARHTDIFELIERFQPEMLMMASPLVHEPLIREARYLPVLIGGPGKTLWMRKDFFRENARPLVDAWLRHDYALAEKATLASPFAVDFGVAPVPAPLHFRRTAIGRIPGVDEEVLHTRDVPGIALAWTQAFTIDFDELRFLFAANHDFLTAAQLYVDGLMVYELVGQPQPEGPAQLPPLETIELPVYAWKGRQAVIAFVSAEGAKGHLAADHLASHRYRSSVTFDDFESGAYDPARWSATFGAAPQDTLELAKLGGVQLAQGRFAASSLGLPGEQVMESRPFRIENDHLAFTVYDFGSRHPGDQRTRVELRVDGHRRHHYVARGRQGLDLVKWDLRALRGQEAVLILRDDTPEPWNGLGIDSLLLFDE